MTGELEKALRVRLEYILAAGMFGVGILYLARLVFTEGLISGTRTDTFIQIAILQNWSNCLSGYGSCLAPNYFYPFPSTLGYNDGYLISGVLFHVFRLAGFDPYIAYELVYVAVRLVGYCAVIVLCVRFLRMPLWAAILAAWIGLISINQVNQIEHTQLIYGALVPMGLLLLLLLLSCLERLPDAPQLRPAASGWAAALAVLSATWAITAFYSFFYFFFFTLFFLFVYALLRPRKIISVVRGLNANRSVAAALVLGAALTPLAVWMIYGATLMKSEGHGWTTVYSPRLYDLFNVGPANLVWSSLLSKLYTALSGQPMGYSELAVGFPLLFLACLVFASVYLVRFARHLPAAATDVRDNHAGLVVAIWVAALLSVLVVLVVGNVTIWRLYWNILPGAKAIRVPSRFLIFATPLLAMAVAYVSVQVLAGWSRSARRAVVAALFVLLSVEQYNSRPVFGLHRETELAFFESLPAPPEGCRSFYVSASRHAPTGSREFDRFYTHSVDAMLVAALHRIPTVNGMASFQPQGWNLGDPFLPDYETRVMAYAARYGIADGLCALSLKPVTWSRR